MFSSVARERRDARPRGRASGPEADHLQVTSTEVARARLTGPGSTGAARRAGTGRADLTWRRIRPGKFYQVAPQRGREAGADGARLILENSTVCQKSTN